MSETNKITMKEIAELSGVGKSTVSRYFNGGYVKEETRQRIASVIEKYNYEPNVFARLKAKKSKMIGIIAPCLDSIVTGKVLMSIDRHLRGEGYSTMIINTDHHEELELQYMEKLWRMNVDGLILSATHLSEAHYELLAKIDIPVVVAAQNYRNGVCIINDDYYGGEFPACEKETEFLINLAQKVAFDAIITIHTPYKIINYDGIKNKNTLPLARKISNFLNYPLEEDIGYPTPGSMGTYFGIEKNIPIITIECDENEDKDKLYLKFEKLFKYLECEY